MKATRTAAANRSCMLSTDAESLLDFFRRFRVGQGEMLCFFGATFDKHCRALRQFTAQGLLVQERFHGGYALTPTGFAAVNERSRAVRTNRNENQSPGRRMR